MGLFGGLDWDRISSGLGAAGAFLEGDYAGGAAINARSRAARDARRAAEAEAEAAQRARDEQIWGLKESGFGNPQIAAMSASDASQLARTRLEPYSQAPGTMRNTPSVNGGETERFTAPDPTEVQRNYEFLRQQNPALAESYLAKQSLIINSGIDPATGEPYSQAINPRDLFNFDGPQAPPVAPPQAGPAAAPVAAAPVPQPGTFSFNRVPGDQQTSGYRTPERNRQVGGVPNSFHTVRDAQGNPMASDRVPPQGMSMEAFHAQLRRANPHLDVINEGDHVHLEPRGSPNGRAQGPRRITSREDLDRLPSGTEYIAPDGSVRRKR